MSTARAFIFDVDGTIVDSNRLHAQAWVQTFADHGRTVTLDQVLIQIGKGSDKLVPALAPDLPADEAKSMRSETPRHFRRLANERGIERLPGIDQIFAVLKSRGIRTAIATSARRDDFEEIVKISGVDLPGLTDEVVVGDDVKESKPDPDLVELAIAQLKLPASACVMVGDTPYDVEASVRAGARAVALRTGVHSDEALKAAGADWIYADLAQLAEHVRDVIDGRPAAE